VITSILGKEQRLESWQTVFCVAGAIYCVGAAIYFVLVQAKPQKWNFVDSAPEETELEKSTDQKKLEVPKM